MNLTKNNLVFFSFSCYYSPKKEEDIFMSIKTVCVHRYVIPPLNLIQRKYYYLIASLLFEYRANEYYRDDLEIFGFNEAESNIICEIFPYFYQDGKAIKTEDFTYTRLGQMISILPEDKKELLIDHIVLSSIDQSLDIESLSYNLKIKLYKVRNSIPLENFTKLDFYQFFIGQESTFINKYYPSENEKNEIRAQYSLKHRS